MQRLVLIAVTLVIVAAARPAPAAYFTGCCACVETDKASTAGPPSPTPQPALFCGLVEGMEGPAFADRCENAGGGDVSCADPAPGESCAQALAGVGIACPGRPGAPVAAGWGLTGLIAALGALGAGALHRRRR